MIKTLIIVNCGSRDTSDMTPLSECAAESIFIQLICYSNEKIQTGENAGEIPFNSPMTIANSRRAQTFKGRKLTPSPPH